MATTQPQLERTNDGWLLRATDMDEMIHATVRSHLDQTSPDAVLNIETHLFNVTLIADSCEYNLDVGKHLWLNSSRWSRLIKEYVPKEPLNRFLGQCIEISNREARLGATANFIFRDPDRFAKKHRWGGCLMGATFRGDNDKSGRMTLTMYSRTSYMGYMALLDAAIANAIVRMISGWAVKSGKRLVMLSDVQLRWHLSSMQLHCFKTLPYVYSQPDLMARLERYARQRRGTPLSPTWKHLTVWYRKVLDHWERSARNPVEFLASEKYGPFRRIKRRWLEHMKYSKKHVPPNLSCTKLDFGKAV